MSNFRVDQRVRIKQSAFGDSQDPQDIAFRGQVVTLAFDLGKQLGPEWKGCWEAWTDDNQPVQLTEDEMERVN